MIGLREIVRSGSHKANNYKGSIYMVGAGFTCWYIDRVAPGGLVAVWAGCEAVQV